PSHPQALYLLGLLLLDIGRSHEAVVSLEMAARSQPGHAGTQINLIRALLADQRPAEALTEAGLCPRPPESVDIAFLRGTALNALGQPAEAVTVLEHAVALDPTNAAAVLNLGNACADLDRLGEAEAYYRRAIELAPKLLEAYASLGFVLTSCGRLEEAIATCESAITLRQDFAQAHWNQAVAALLAGNFELGFRKYEWRKRHDRFGRDFIDLPGPQWDASDCAGRTILVRAEQGLGDTIQFARYLPLIAARGGYPVVVCDQKLIQLLAGMPGVAIEPKTAPLPPYDCWIDQMSLPRVFATRVDSIPSADGYLGADPTRVAYWGDTLPAGSKVGIAWAGNSAHNNDRRLSLPDADLARIIATPGIVFVNLQVGSRSADSPLADISALLINFAETAALIAALDLVLTVDTAVAHVAGAIGKQTWVMLPHAPDWRWLLGRDDTPWYSSLRLFRRPAAGNWNAVTSAVATSLAEWRDRQDSSHSD
ncbi:MAG: tetratricopeptide repeat protein, partial [Acetobacteraceae bacterium]